MNIRISRKMLICITFVAVFAAAALGVAVVNGIPDANGVIHGCYKKNNGQLRVVESDAACNPSEEAISWSQTGPPGPGVTTVAGFVRADGSQYGTGFTVTKLSTGRYKLVLPNTKFSDFPAIAVSGWGIPGQAPIVNVVFNISTPAGFESEIFVVAADGVTFIDGAFQFVASQVSQ